MLTRRVLWLVGLALAPALAIQSYNEVALRTAREDAVRAEVLRAAKAGAEALDVVGDSMREALAFIAQEASIRDRDAVACTAYLRAARDNLPGVALLSLTDVEGRTVCNSLGSAPGTFVIAQQRAYHQRALATGALALGDYAEGQASGQKTLHLAQPLRDATGAPIGVISAAVELRWLAERLTATSLPPNTALSVIDGTGRVLARVPNHELWVGRQVEGRRLAELQASVGATRDTLTLEGQPSIAGVVRPTGLMSPLTVSAGRDRAAAFADIDAATRRGMILIVLGAVLALAAALVAGRVLIRRPARQLLAAARAWRQGELGVRTGVSGLSEFGQLGEAFDAMAGSLERSECDLRSEIGRGHVLQEQQAGMLHELNHRVKNTLATVQSLARQSRRSDAGEGGIESLERRILALSKTHDLLTRDEWTGASLREVLENELGPYRNSVDHFTLDGPEVALAPRQVLALGMTVHELTTNAAKYGALSTGEGRVHVDWEIARGEAGGQRLRLTWREVGGPPVSEPTRRGFGTRLIAGGVQRELAGEVHLAFEAQGVRCRLDVPLDLPTADLIAQGSHPTH